MICTLLHIVKRSVRFHLIAGFCRLTTSEQIFVVSMSFCGWRTNTVTTVVEGLPTRSQSRGVRAGRCVNGIGIVIAVRVVGAVQIP